MSDIFIFSIFSSDIPLDFHESIQVVPLKHLIYFLAGINTNSFWKIPEEKYFAVLRILSLFIKSFVNPFVGIALTFFDNSFNSFLFKSAFFTKLAISLLLAKFACASLAVKRSDVNLLNSWVVKYLSWSWSVVILFSVSPLFMLKSVFFWLNY